MRYNNEITDKNQSTLVSRENFANASIGFQNIFFHKGLVINPNAIINEIISVLLSFFIIPPDCF